jgi:hypothetical protein
MSAARNVEKARRKAERLRADAEAIRKGKEREDLDIEYDADNEGKEEAQQRKFHNYKPPRRLLALEIIVIILLVMLLLINPNGFTAISMRGTDTVGLLSMSPSSYSVQY